jgi:hypothetical protein
MTDIAQKPLYQQFHSVVCVAPAEGNQPIKHMKKANEQKYFPALYRK